MGKRLHIEYSCFDIDDNLLHMPTKVNMVNLKSNKVIPVSSEDFSIIRNDKDNWSLANNAFIEFNDKGPRGDNAFLEDLKYAVNNGDFAPSWDKFIHTLINGNLFALITARGHEPNSIRKGIEWIIDNYLTDDQKMDMYMNIKKYIYHFNELGKLDNMNKLPNLKNFTNDIFVSNYLSQCDYYGVSNEKYVNRHRTSGAESPEVGKEIALKEFVTKVKRLSDKIGATISVGMSDDDVKNITHVEKVFTDLKKIYPDTIFRLYDTSKRGYIKKIIERFSDFKENSTMTPGLESSIMPFASFNNLMQGTNPGNFTPGGNEDRQDDYGYALKQKVKILNKTKFCKCCNKTKSECDCPDDCKCKCKK